jgi:hypothetical protein
LSASQKPLVVDIKEIGAVGFYYNLRRKENEVFVTSLYKINCLIKEALQNKDEETKEEIKQRLLPMCKDYLDVFSKVASDKLPPHRLYDHKIQLEADCNLGFHLLYKQTAAELLATKQYIVENLGKGFINSSQAPFASLILFVKKPSSGLRFCIDFRRLNAITHKDQYPLPLIDEDPEWYPASNFKYSPYKLWDFYLEHPDLLGPPRRLNE